MTTSTPYPTHTPFAAQYAKEDDAGTLRWHTWSGGLSWEVAHQADSEVREFEPGAYSYRVVPQHIADLTNGKTWNESLDIARAWGHEPIPKSYVITGVDTLREVVAWANQHDETWWHPSPLSGRKIPTVEQVVQLHRLVTKVLKVDTIEDALAIESGTPQERQAQEAIWTIVAGTP